MSHIPDRRSAGRSAIVPFDPNETPQQRHARRKKEALNAKSFIEDWCLVNDATFETKNGDHHWIFRKGKVLVEWWPSSAKCVVNKRWHKGIHTHDHVQLVNILTKSFTNQQPIAGKERRG